MSFESEMKPIFPIRIGSYPATLYLNSNIPSELDETVQENYNHTSSALIRVFGTMEGVFSSLKSFEYTLKIIDYKLPDEWKNASLIRIAEKCELVAFALGLPLCFGLWGRAKSSLSGAWNSGFASRRRDQFIRDGSKALVVTAEALRTLAGLTSQNIYLLQVSKPLLGHIGFLGSLVSLKISLENLYQIHQIHLDSTSVEASSLLEQTKQRDRIVLARHTCSVASGVIRLSAPLLMPPAVRLAFALASFILPLAADIYEEKMRWKPIDCYSSSHIVYSE